MAENPEPHHVPQQNRKSKLRYIPTTSASSAAATTTTTNDQPPPSPLQTTTLLPSLFQLNPPSSISLPQPFHHFPLNLNLNQNDTVSTVPGGFLSHDLRSSVPLGPFTGYASILMRSRFLKPTEQILGDWCGVYGKDASDFHGDHGFCEIGVRDFLAFSDRIERSWKNSKLVVMLEEVYGKYKVYRQQMETVVSSFETVAGLGNAAPFVSCAFKSVAKHFVCLKNAILDQLHLSSSSSSSAASINDGRNVCRSNNNNSNIRVWNNNDEHGGVISSNNHQINHGRINIQQNAIWRSQRGLPDYAVSVLKTWLFDNFLHPYPSDSEKQMLAQQTGLSRNQVSNWFINARVRLWKPMVEEIHTLETRQAAQTPPEVVAENHDINKHSDQHQPRKIPQGNEEPQHLPTKRPCRIKSSHLSNSTYNQGDDHRGHHPHHQVQQNASYNNLSTNQQLTAVNVPVTLALGLHHNIGISQHYRQP